MRPLSVQRLVEYSELEVVVTAWSTIRVQHNTYSVPSRLVGQRVRVRVYDDRLEVLHAGKPQLVVDKLVGRNGHRINYRHIIWSLVQKPGAFAQYRYREDLFPSLVFRRAYDELQRVHAGRAADVEYLRILHLAASTLESQVEQVLARLLAEGALRGAEQVKALVAPARPEVPELAQPEVDLSSYDALLVEQREVAS
ncbi:Mu transposase domain-containing protein [Archangium lansingense]|uniref:Mu transposase domain-containing protein n=1 Tax=Archangium lansingense TaxID=2995310 RepID=UPI003B7BE874